MARKTALKAYKYRPGKEHEKKLYPYYAGVVTGADIHHPGKWSKYVYDPDKDDVDNSEGDRGGFSVTSVDRVGPGQDEGPGLAKREAFKTAVLDLLMNNSGLDEMIDDWSEKNKLYEVQLGGRVQHGADIRRIWDNGGVEALEDDEDNIDSIPFVDNDEEHLGERVKPHREIKLSHPDKSKMSDAAFEVLKGAGAPLFVSRIIDAFREPSVIKVLRGVGLKPKSIRNIRTGLEHALDIKNPVILKGLGRTASFGTLWKTIQKILDTEYTNQTAEDAVEEHARSRNAISDEALKIFTRKY